MKKAVIFDHAGGELANQLWNYVSMYAFCRQHGYILENLSFYEYSNYFSFQSTSNIFFKLFFCAPFTNDIRRKQSLKKRVWRSLYKIYILYIRLFHKKTIISSISSSSKPVYLSKIPEKNKIYFRGWLFRNPQGIETYRSDIQNYFKPRKDIEDEISKIITTLRQKYNHIVGIHLRQGDYATWRNGTYAIPQPRVREIINEYLIETQKTKEKTFFIITSDGKIDSECFKNLNYYVSDKTMVADLFMLASCDVVIGSNSSFGDFAAYYGNIPHIVFEKEAMPWEYYKNKTTFFENKYCTVVHY